VTQEEIHQLLEEKYQEYCQPKFIETDPIQVPHLFEDKLDIEISGLISATIAWGQRPTIIKNARSAMKRMGNEPYRFVTEHSTKDLRSLDGFVHRTFNSEDLKQFIRVLRALYSEYETLETVFLDGIESGDHNLKKAISHFRSHFLSVPHEKRFEKHISDPMKNSAAKRLRSMHLNQIRQIVEE